MPILAKRTNVAKTPDPKKRAGYSVRFPDDYQAILEALATRNRRTIALEAKIAVDLYRALVEAGVSDQAAMPLDLMGTIAAGPDDVPTVYDPPEKVTFFKEYPKDSFALEVTGNSCARWGFREGDLIVVARETRVREGQFHVLRSTGGAHTLKAYSRGKWWQFRPNDGEPIEYLFEDNTNVFGVVVGGRYGEREFHAPVKPKK